MSKLKSLFKHITGGDRKIGTLISFPKSGRTWIRVMLDNLEVRLQYTHAGSEYSTACHYDDLPLPSSVKVNGRKLFLFRDPRDTVVSGYFQKTKRKKKSHELLDLTCFIRDPRYGIEKIARFNMLWLNRQNYLGLRNYRAISYEALRHDPVAGLTAIYTHLKGHAPRRKDLIEQIVEEASFSRMQAKEKSGELANQYGSILRPGDYNDPESFKVRRGKIGGYEDYLTEDDVQYCNQALLSLGYEELLLNNANIMLL